MDPKLRRAFLQARYHIDAPGGELLLAVDEPSRALATLLRAHQARSMALLTACNPQGRVQEERVNVAAQARLAAELAARNLAWLPGRNEDPHGDWPDEASMLVLGIDLQTARALAASHRQLAFLWAVADEADAATPRLIETAAPQT